MLQGQQHQPTIQWNNTNEGGNKKDKKKKGEKNGRSNQPSWHGGGTNNNRWSCAAFPPNTRIDNNMWYCWPHKHNKGHTSGEYKMKCAGPQNNERSHLGTGGNPESVERMVFPAQIGLIGFSKYKAMQASAIPVLSTWNQHATMGIGI